MYNRRKPRAEDPFTEVTVYLPKSLGYVLKSISDEKDLPVSRLICIAIDKELDQKNHFDYPCILPESTYVEFAYAEEAKLIVEYLRKFVSGTGRDMLMLCRRDIGISSRAVFMLAYRELLETQIIEEFRPTRTKFQYAKNYKYVRLVSNKPELRKKRYKPVIGRLDMED